MFDVTFGDILIQVILYISDWYSNIDIILLLTSNYYADGKVNLNL
jgi:hypothetical protein